VLRLGAVGADVTGVGWDLHEGRSIESADEQVHNGEDELVEVHGGGLEWLSRVVVSV
jgi:hypothetical protein